MNSVFNIYSLIFSVKSSASGYNMKIKHMMLLKRKQTPIGK